MEKKVLGKSLRYKWISIIECDKNYFRQYLITKKGGGDAKSGRN